MSHLDEYRNNNIAGMATSTDAAANMFHCVENWSMSFWKPIGHVNIAAFCSITLAIMNSLHAVMKLNRPAIANAGVDSGTMTR